MELIKNENHGVSYVTVESDAPVLTDAQSAVELLANAQYTAGTKNLILQKRLVDERFFVLSSGLAGEILQKIVNYGGRIAIWGDYSRYTSKPLKDFMYESNQGHDVFFTQTKEEAVERITAEKI